MGTEVTPRERLVAQVALLQPEDGKGWTAGAWKAAEQWVFALEAAPTKPVQCPCCTKLVQLCTKHYQLHEPGKPCVYCRRGE